ncbi:MAG: hypothetical protein QNJ68_12490 [Microcoleaceae cyanobacterium MO_207.B10]|nr:hypothetical protein [Microcoleaceae cyanobacterium MO_207.B10]
MAIHKQEVEENVVIDDNLPTDGIDSEFLLNLQESQSEFDGWLDKVRERREKSLDLLEEVRQKLEHIRHNEFIEGSE